MQHLWAPPRRKMSIKNCEWVNHSTNSWATSIEGIKLKEKLNYDYLPKMADPPQGLKRNLKTKRLTRVFTIHFVTLTLHKYHLILSLLLCLTTGRKQSKKKQKYQLIADYNFISTKLAAYLNNRAQIASQHN